MSSLKEVTKREPFLFYLK